MWKYLFFFPLLPQDFVYPRSGIKHSGRAPFFYTSCHLWKQTSHLNALLFFTLKPQIMKWRKGSAFTKKSQQISFVFKYIMIHVGTSYLLRSPGDIPQHQQPDNKVQEGEMFPFTPTFSPSSACPTPATVDRDPNHYWHTAPSPLCGFLSSLARSATGPPPHFDLDLGGNVIQRGAEAQRHYCSHAVGPSLHIRLSSLAGPHAPARRLLL